MHLPDGIVSATPLTIGLSLAGLAGVAVASKESRFRRAGDMAWTGTIAAFVLAIQAVNVPLVPGASAHAIGATLAVLTLGPARAVLALFAVLLIQALLFADGGVTALGINALTIAVLPVLAVEAFRRLFAGLPRGLELAAVTGSLVGNLAAATLLSLALVDGAAAPLALTASWLIGVHALSGVIEGVLTAIAVRRLGVRAPALLERTETTAAARGSYRVAAVAVVVVLALLPFASNAPDALQVVLSQLQAEP
ncbi:MAG TPA: energy-coupling factor ABC transporter permease [Polyangiaceae bacterium]|nr:energy-coupling factor ABC transporter permease [Polyangiaceae bacterium]